MVQVNIKYGRLYFSRLLIATRRECCVLVGCAGGESGPDGSCSAQYALRYSVLWLHQHITSSSTAVAQCWILTNVTTHNLISLQHYTCTPLPSHCLPDTTLVPVCTFYIHLMSWVSDVPLSTMMDEHLVSFIKLMKSKRYKYIQLQVNMNKIL